MLSTAGSAGFAGCHLDMLATAQCCPKMHSIAGCCLDMRSTTGCCTGQGASETAVECQMGATGVPAAQHAPSQHADRCFEHFRSPSLLLLPFQANPICACPLFSLLLNLSNSPPVPVASLRVWWMMTWCAWRRSAYPITTGAFPRRCQSRCEALQGSCNSLARHGICTQGAA